MLKIYKTLYILTLGQETHGINSQGSPINNKYQGSDNRISSYKVIWSLPVSLRIYKVFLYIGHPLQTSDCNFTWSWTWNCSTTALLINLKKVNPFWSYCTNKHSTSTRVKAQKLNDEKKCLIHSANSVFTWKLKLKTLHLKSAHLTCVESFKRSGKE